MSLVRAFASHRGVACALRTNGSPAALLASAFWYSRSAVRENAAAAVASLPTVPPGKMIPLSASNFASLTSSLSV